MRRVAAFAGLLAFCCFRPPVFGEDAEVVQGLVIDRDGQGVDKAEVHFYAEYNREVGHGRAGQDGRFTVHVSALPETWSAGASNYQTQTVRFTDRAGLVMVLYPPEPQAPGQLQSADLAVLPYSDSGYAFSLQPFTIIQGGPSIGIGDRGLSGSANALEDNGSSFDEIPAHYLAFAGVSRAFHSYRYSNGAAGHYTVGFDRSDPADAQAGSGSLQLAAMQGRFGTQAFGYGSSAAEMVRRSRWDLVSRNAIGAGKLLFLASSGSLFDRSASPEAIEGEDSTELRLDEPWLGATATFELKADRKTKDKIGDYNEPESAIETEVRLKTRAAPFGSEIGFKRNYETGFRSQGTKYYEGRGIENRLFASETYTVSRFNVLASGAWYGLTFNGATHKLPAGLSQNTGGVAASLAAQWQFSDRFAFEVTRGDIVDTPSISGQFFGDPIPQLVLNHSNLSEASLIYRSPADFSVDVTDYSERYSTASPTTRLSGRGIAVDWPISRAWRVQAWTLSLRESAQGLSTQELGPSFGRDIAWITYYGARNVRFDAIYRRETDPVEAGRYLDGDAAWNVGRNFTVIATMEHHRNGSSAGVSLRVNVPK